MASQNIDIIIQAKDLASKSINGIRGTLGGLKTAVASAAKGLAIAQTAIAGVGLFGVRSAAQIEQTRVAFENLYGSAEQAGKMMKNLSDFAKKTPFEFGELTDVALKLKNVAGIGDEELIPMLTNLGDIAASQAKPISQIVEAYNDAITGEFERLKEFGIKARQEGDNVTFTFKGQEQTVKKTSESIGEYLQSIGQAEGIVGAMDKQSQTLNGRLSTMKDQFKGLAMALVGVSETGEIIAGGVFDRISQAVAGLGTWLETNQEQIISYMGIITGIFSTGFDIIYNALNQLLTGGTGQWSSFFADVQSIVMQGLQIISDFWKKYGDDIIIVVKFLFEVISGIVGAFFENIMPIIETGLEIIGGFFKLFSDIIQGNWGEAFKSIIGIAQDSILFISQIIKTILDMFLSLFGTSTEQIAGYVYNTIQSFINLKDSIVGIGEEIYIGFSGWITSLVDSIKEKLDAVMNFVSEKVEQARKILSNIASAAKEAIGNAASKVSNVVGARASGGAVTQNRAYLVGENGPELFVPRTSGSVQSSGSNQNINISLGNVNVYNEADENRLVDKIKQALRNETKAFNYGIA